MVKLSNDLSVSLPDGGPTITVFDGIDKGSKKPKGDGTSHNTQFGELKFILVSGCTKVTFVQFLWKNVEVRPAGGAWQDAGDPPIYRHWGPDEFNMKIPPIGDEFRYFDPPGLDFAQKMPTMQNGSKVRLTWKLETFICCDGTLLGYVSWGFTLESVYQGGKPGNPVVTKIPPQWHAHDPNNPSPQAGKVKCP